MNDVLIAKKASLERCVEQVKRYVATPGPIPFEEDFMRQDAVALNIQRACEMAIDMANHLIRVRKLGVPQSTKESFGILGRENVLSLELANSMMKMVGFRNILVHRYQELDVVILKTVIDKGVISMLEFARVALDAGGD